MWESESARRTSLYVECVHVRSILKGDQDFLLTLGDQATQASIEEGIEDTCEKNTEIWIEACLHNNLIARGDYNTLDRSDAQVLVAIDARHSFIHI